MSRYNDGDTSNISIADGFIPFTETFRYLGSHIHSSLSDKHEIELRISAASAMFGSLKSTLCARQVSLPRKGRIFSVLVHSILLYGSEAWALTRELSQSLLSLHNKCVRKMNRITLEQTEQYRITTSSLEAKLGIRSIQAIIDNRCMRWAGHVARMPEQRAPRRLLSSWVRAKRPIGRPQMSIAHCIRDTIKRAGLSPHTWITDANDRDHWKDIALHVKPKISRKSSKAPTARPKIKLGPDGYDERCYNCLQIGRRNHRRGELACCDAPNCTAAWHACCVGVASLDLLPDPWHCPKCVGFGVS